jgi:hypothetical protein
MPKPLSWKFIRPTPDGTHRLLTEYCIDVLSQIMANADAPVSMRRKAADKRRRLRSGDLATCDIIGWANRRPQTDYWRRSSLLITIDHADVGNEEVVAKAKEEGLAEHVALHPKDAGRTVEDFKWMVWKYEDADGPSVTLH